MVSADRWGPALPVGGRAGGTATGKHGGRLHAGRRFPGGSEHPSYPVKLLRRLGDCPRVSLPWGPAFPALAGWVGPATPVAYTLVSISVGRRSGYMLKPDDYVMLGVVVRFLEVGR